MSVDGQKVRELFSAMFVVTDELDDYILGKR